MILIQILIYIFLVYLSYLEKTQIETIEFLGYFYYLLKKLKKKLRVKEFNSQFKQIKAFYSTIIDITSKLALDLYYNKDISAIKMSILFNLTEAAPEKVYFKCNILG